MNDKEWFMVFICIVIFCLGIVLGISVSNNYYSKVNSDMTCVFKGKTYIMTPVIKE